MEFLALRHKISLIEDEISDHISNFRSQVCIEIGYPIEYFGQCLQECDKELSEVLKLALILHSKWKGNRVSPNVIDYIFSLKLCVSLYIIDAGKNLVWESSTNVLFLTDDESDESLIDDPLDYTSTEEEMDDFQQPSLPEHHSGEILPPREGSLQEELNPFNLIDLHEDSSVVSLSEFLEVSSGVESNEEK